MIMLSFLDYEEKLDVLFLFLLFFAKVTDMMFYFFPLFEIFDAYSDMILIIGCTFKDHLVIILCYMQAFIAKKTFD
jgi:hypothetical protein